MRLAVTAVIVMGAGTAAVQAQDSNWSGVWLGVSGSVHYGVSQRVLQDDQYCFSATSNGQHAECIVNASTAFAGSSANIQSAGIAATGQGTIGNGLAETTTPSSSSSSSPSFYQPFEVRVPHYAEPRLAFRSFANEQDTDAGIIGIANAVGAYADGIAERALAYSATEVLVDGDVQGQAFAIGLLNILDFDSLENGDGWSVGGQFHVDHAFDNGVVAGLGGKIAVGLKGSDLSDHILVQDDIDEGIDIDLTSDLKADAVIAAQGRLGFDMGRWMPYLTAGVAAGHFSASSTLDFDILRDEDDPEVATDLRSVASDASAWAVGALVGGGVSYFLTDDVLLGMEASLIKFDEKLVVENLGSVAISDQYSVTASLSFRM